MSWVYDVVQEDGVIMPTDDGKDFHPHQQWVSGFLDLLEKVTKPGQVVCDPICGSGTTGMAAVRLGREFIGMDMDPAHVKTAQARISQEIKDQQKDVERK